MALSLANLQTLLDTSSDIVAIIDAELRVLSIGKTIEAIRNDCKAPFPLIRILAKRDCETIARIIERFEQNAVHAVEELQVSLCLSDGRRVPALLSLAPLLDDNAGPHFLAVIQARIPRGFLLNRTMASQLFAASNEPILVLDAERFVILDCNKAAEAFFGTRRETLQGQSCAQLSPHKEQGEDWIEKRRLELEAGGVVRNRRTMKGPWNSSIRCEVIEIALYDKCGSLAGELCILRDLSEERALEANVKRIAKGYRACMQELDLLTASFSDTDSSPSLSSLGLSRRQVEIVRLVAVGKTTKSIAQDLGLSESAIKSHLTVVFRKTQTQTRAQLLSFLTARNMLLD
jgi:PAS domain S-box